MNGGALGLLVVLLRTTVFLGGAAIAVRLVLKFGRPASPAVHRVVWLLVLLTGWFWWRLPVTIPYHETAARQQPASAVRAVEEQLPVQHWADAGQETPAQPIAATSPPPSRRLPADREPGAVIRATWPVTILGVWLSGMFALVMVWITRYFGSLRQLRAAGPAEEAWVRQWDDLCAASGVTAAIPFRATESLGPLLCRAPRGYLLVVPAVLWRQLTPTERLSILQHELAHWKRRDLLKSTAIRLMALPHWFNPLAWLAAGWFDEAAEWACDEAAKGATSDGRQAYAKALLQLDAVLGPRLSYHAAASGRGLSARIQRLLLPQPERDSLVKKATIFAVALGLALLCLVRLELVATEPAAKGQATSTLPKGLVINFAADLGDKLTEAQRLYCEWDAETFGLPDPAQWQSLNSQQRAAKEEELLKQLSSDQESERVKAIDGLVALGSKKAVPEILKIAADRKEKNNWDRHTATRALGMLGDSSVVPELVHLTYHYNWNVRQWARIALVRFSGQNFGRNVAAWRQWWDKRGGKPPIDEQTVKWATSPEMLQYADPKSMDEADRQLLWQTGRHGRSTQPTANPPRIVSTSPVDGAKEVDPATAEVTVTFDRDMASGFTWNGDGPDFPFLAGANAVRRNPRTCVLPVKLEPGRSYRVGLNLFSPNFQAFRSVGDARALPTTINFSTRGTRKPDGNAEASKRRPEPPPATPSSQAVAEGIGWEGFRVGATREELIKTYGNPDPNPGNPWMRWTLRYHVDCICDQEGHAVEVRFNKGFSLPLTFGVKIGSSEKDVLSAYGIPDNILLQSQAKMLVYHKRGVLMWVIDDKVFDFTVTGQRPAGGSMIGIGTALAKEKNRVVVREVFAGSSAASAGLQPGDELLQIDGQAVKADVRGRCRKNPRSGRHGGQDQGPQEGRERGGSRHPAPAVPILWRQHGCQTNEPDKSRKLLGKVPTLGRLPEGDRRRYHEPREGEETVGRIGQRRLCCHLPPRPWLCSQDAGGVPRQVHVQPRSQVDIDGPGRGQLLSDETPRRGLDRLLPHRDSRRNCARHWKLRHRWKSSLSRS